MAHNMQKQGVENVKTELLDLARSGKRRERMVEGSQWRCVWVWWVAREGVRRRRVVGAVAGNIIIDSGMRLR